MVTDSGWREAPRLRDLTEVAFGGSVFQVDGTVVPVADVNLGAGESVFFEHHVMLWKDEQVAMSVMSSPGGAKRLLADLPFVLSVAQGPGRVSFSRDSPGELVVLPIDPGVELDVREHAMIVATTGLTYSFEKLPGLKATLAVGSGMYLDRFQRPTKWRPAPPPWLRERALNESWPKVSPSRSNRGASCTRTPRSGWRR